MNTITFKGKEYPTRTFKVRSPEFLGEQTYKISVDSLFLAFEDKYEDETTEAFNIDNTIYFYVEDTDINLSGKEICNNCLDIPMELIEEIFE